MRDNPKLGLSRLASTFPQYDATPHLHYCDILTNNDIYQKLGKPIKLTVIIAKTLTE